MARLFDYVDMKMATGLRGFLPDPEEYRVTFLDMQKVFPFRRAAYPEHIAGCYEMIMPENEGYECFLERQKIELETGDFLVIAPGQVHMDLFDPAGAFTAFHFMIRKMGSDEAVHTFFAPGTLPCQQRATLPETERENMRLLKQMLWTESETPAAPKNFHIRNALFQTVFWKCVSAYPLESLRSDFCAASAGRKSLSRVLSVFEEELRRTPSLDDLCRKTAMSRSSLTRLCNQEFGLPPLKAFMKFKVNRAGQLIRSSPNMKVKEVSDYFRFENPFHFSRVFRKYTGHAPSRYSHGLDSDR
jgi:AraC-like DNA-binding protein